MKLHIVLTLMTLVALTVHVHAQDSTVQVVTEPEIITETHEAEVIYQYGCGEPQCKMHCSHGFARNDNGCLICRCNKKSDFTNIALKKPTWQSSTCCAGPSSKAVDGKAFTNYFKKSCTATGHEPNPWWQVDLGQQSLVDSIEITNRADCCPGRLHDLIIGVSDSRDVDRLGKNSRARSFPFPTCKIVIGALGKGETRRVQCTNPMKGRYVTILIAGNKITELLTLCEVKVFGKPVGSKRPMINLALKKKTWQSSTWHAGKPYAGVSQYAVDGNINPHFLKKSCTATNYQKRPWWTVDLGSEQTVGSVVITNRKDCCAARLHDIIIGVSSSHNKGVITGSTFPYPICAMVQGAWAAGETKEIKCHIPLVGRYVTIMIPGKHELLTLCEVKVYAP